MTYLFISCRHGLLPTTELSAALLNKSELQKDEDSGSDFDVD